MFWRSNIPKTTSVVGLDQTNYTLATISNRYEYKYLGGNLVHVLDVHQPILTLVYTQRLCPETFIDLNVSLRILFSKNAFNEEFEEIT